MSLPTATVQRLRITYRVGWPACYLSVLDQGRLWERLLRRVGAPLAYSQGFNPHPRMAFGSALPVGYSSACEVLDIWLAERVPVEDLAPRLGGQCPTGITVRRVCEVPLSAASPQAQMRQAEYLVTVWEGPEPAELQGALQALLSQESIARVRWAKGKERAYDLRPLIHAARYVGATDDGGQRIHLLLACGPEGSGRAEEVLAALGLESIRREIHRTRLLWDGKEEA